MICSELTELVMCVSCTNSKKKNRTIACQLYIIAHSGHPAHTHTVKPLTMELVLHIKVKVLGVDFDLIDVFFFVDN